MRCQSRRSAIVQNLGFAAAVALSLAFAGAAHAQAVRAQSAPAPSAKPASADDTAKFLAGMPVSADSPLAALSQNPAAKQHTAYFDRAFGELDKAKLSKIRTWAAANLTTPKPTLFYLFGGPDFLYADTFFPDVKTYVLSGLESAGPIPGLTRMSPGFAFAAQQHIAGSLRSVLTLSYFITKQMSGDLNSGPLPGTLPLIYVFLARTGNTLHDVSQVFLDEKGELHPGDRTHPLAPASGVKVTFADKGGTEKTLYYFRSNLADMRGDIALLTFCRSLGQGESFIKSASYLLHTAGFTQTRNFLLDNSAAILEDDTGVPLKYFDTAKWDVHPFGHYVVPIFPGYYQPDMVAFFQKMKAPPIDFGVGYRFGPNQSSLLWAVKK
jgi:hypothetical protein